MMSASRTLCAVAKKALGSSNCSGENNGVNSAWYLILETMHAASAVKETGVPEGPESKCKE